jgi:hypothetical protein
MLRGGLLCTNTRSGNGGEGLLSNACARIVGWICLDLNLASAGAAASFLNVFFLLLAYILLSHYYCSALYPTHHSRDTLY